ncbi:MAG: response regulator [Bacteroidota bacterium]|nr:response regulator [Bacteroidota bacterium]
MKNLDSSLYQHLKILVAEDNDINRLIVKSILGKWGNEMKLAQNGNEVLAYIQSEPFDLVLMDIQMPEKDGIAATIEIRQLEDTSKKNIPIIALTANGLIGEAKKYIDSGMNGYLIKPFTENQLLMKIHEVFTEPKES